jgi:hypothetical protein
MSASAASLNTLNYKRILTLILKGFKGFLTLHVTGQLKTSQSGSNCFATKRDFRADRSPGWHFGLGGQSLKLLLQPSLTPQGKIFGGGNGASPWDCHSHSAIWTEAKQISSRPWMMHHQQRHHSGVDL